jgi:hypothetical protein
MAYTKIFRDLVYSTIWRREDDATRLVWITMLALRDGDHVVRVNVVGLADLARVSDEDCKKSLEVLQSPDPNGMEQEYEGRRIERVEEGWLILNGEKYRQKESVANRKDYNARMQREHRARAKMHGKLAHSDEKPHRRIRV